MNGHFAVYYVGNEFHSVDDPMDIRIMELLSCREMTITEVAESLFKSPSTVTTHLRNLKKGGLLKSRVSEKDSRATIYYIGDCEMVAEGDPDIIHDGTFGNIVESIVSKNMPLMEGIFKMFIYGLASMSVDVVPSMVILARRMGSIIASRSPKGDFYQLLTGIKDFISSAGVGEMTFSLSNCITVRILSQKIQTDCDYYLTREFCSNLIKEALEKGSGKKMASERSEREGEYLTLKFFFTEV